MLLLAVLKSPGFWAACAGSCAAGAATGEPGHRPVGVVGCGSCSGDGGEGGCCCCKPLHHCWSHHMVCCGARKRRRPPGF